MQTVIKYKVRNSPTRMDKVYMLPTEQPFMDAIYIMSGRESINPSIKCGLEKLGFTFEQVD